MPRGLVVAGRPVLFRLLVGGRLARSTREAREALPDSGVTFTAADHDYDGLDAVAGSEYADDRIRFQE